MIAQISDARNVIAFPLALTGTRSNEALAGLKPGVSRGILRSGTTHASLVRAFWLGKLRRVLLAFIHALKHVVFAK